MDGDASGDDVLAELLGDAPELEESGGEGGAAAAVNSGEEMAELDYGAEEAAEPQEPHQEFEGGAGQAPTDQAGEDAVEGGLEAADAMPVESGERSPLGSGDADDTPAQQSNDGDNDAGRQHQHHHQHHHTAGSSEDAPGRARPTGPTDLGYVGEEVGNSNTSTSIALLFRPLSDCAHIFFPPCLI